MPDTIPKTVNDERPIQCISVCNGTDSDLYCVGQSKGISKIVPYYEAGEMANVTWFAIYYGERLSVRVNGTFVMEINY